MTQTSTAMIVVEFAIFVAVGRFSEYIHEGSCRLCKSGEGLLFIKDLHKVSMLSLSSFSDHQSVDRK